MACMSAAVYLLIMMSFIMLVPAYASMENRIQPGAAAPGDIIIGAIFPNHEAVEKTSNYSPHTEQCIKFHGRGLADTLALINAIETMNKSPILGDVGITMGYRIYDDCSDISTALRATAEFTRQDDCGGGTNYSSCYQPVMVVVGSTFSEMSIAIARQLTTRMIPQISYSSSAVILSDKSRFPAFMRTIPNDMYQTGGMVRLLNAYGWNWVGMITTDGDYGRSALDNFVTQATEKGICVAFKEILPGPLTRQDAWSAIRRATRTILKNHKVKVIVAFMKPTHILHLYKELRSELLRTGQPLESMRRIWVASDSWSASNYVHGDLTLEDIGHVVGFNFKHGSLSSFNQYLSRLGDTGHDNKGYNYFLEELKTQLNASGDAGEAELVSKAIEIIRKYTYADTILSTEMAVSAIAQAVAVICRSRDCKAPGAVQPWEVLRALWMRPFWHNEKKYKFDDKGDINLGYDLSLWRTEKGIIHNHDIVAMYHPHNNSLTYTDHSTTKQLLDLKKIVSKCSNSCVPGEFKKTAEGQHTCCYECINCTENYYSNDTDMDQCLSCDSKTEWSPEGSSKCITKTLQFFSWQDSFAVVLLTLAALGILLVLLVSALFLQQRNTPIVRAAGGPLCQVILFSLVGSFISAILFVGKPNIFQCKARQVLFGLSYTLCVSCILEKSLKILFAFQGNPGLQGHLQRLYQPYVIIGGCVGLQAATCSCWLVLKSPFKNVIILPTTLLEECHEGSYVAFGVMLGYIAVLAFVCFVCAFKGRKLPQKYNDARFITFSMLLYLISWVLFIPVYVTTSGVYVPAIEMVVILISNYGILSCHFFPKCYVILFRKEQNTKSAFKEHVYAYCKKSMKSLSVDDTSLKQQKSIDQPYIISSPPLSLPATEPQMSGEVDLVPRLLLSLMHQPAQIPTHNRAFMALSDLAITMVLEVLSKLPSTLKSPDTQVHYFRASGTHSWSTLSIVTQQR
ncbi:G-protein coupled receptor family C group 6 member A-like [Diretmus argenteus]